MPLGFKLTVAGLSWRGVRSSFHRVMMSAIISKRVVRLWKGSALQKIELPMGHSISSHPMEKIIGTGSLSQAQWWQVCLVAAWRNNERLFLPLTGKDSFALVALSFFAATRQNQGQNGTVMPYASLFALQFLGHPHSTSKGSRVYLSFSFFPLPWLRWIIG